MIGLDTHVLARYYVASPDAPTPQQSALARQLIESRRKLFASKSVLLELDWAIGALTDGFDFADALHHASCRQCKQIVTFDGRKFAHRATSRTWKPPVTVVT